MQSENYSTRFEEKSIKEITSHPYLDYKSAKLIHAFLKQHPDISSTNELNQIFSLDQATIEKNWPLFIPEK